MTGPRGYWSGRALVTAALLGLLGAGMAGCAPYGDGGGYPGYGAAAYGSPYGDGDCCGWDGYGGYGVVGVGGWGGWHHGFDHGGWRGAHGVGAVHAGGFAHGLGGHGFGGGGHGFGGGGHGGGGGGGHR